MSEVRPLVSVVLLNYNGQDYLAECLSSLAGQTYGPLEVLVADNGSTDASIDVAKAFPVRWVSLGGRFDFARANNLAAKHAEGLVLVFVNNDMRFDAKFIEELVTPLLSHADVFATDARQMDWTGANEIHSATRLRMRPLTASFGKDAPALPHIAIDQVPAAAPCEVVHACAANMAVQRMLFELLGGFDPLLPAGWEDADISWRAWLKGWKTLYVPTAVCWHHVGQASATEAGAWLRYRGALGGRLRFATKHLPPEDALLVWMLGFAALPKDALRGGWTGFKRRLSVLIETGRNLPSALRERQQMYGLAQVSPRRHIQRLSAIGDAKSTDVITN
jgi:GT2 family glycosyltransferase